MIRFEPFDPNEFKAYVERNLWRYAEEKVRSGNWEKQSALILADQEFKTLLPDGLKTKDHYIYSIVDERSNEKVGIIWFASNVPDIQKNDLFIYDFEIFEKFRRKGYATSALRLLDSKARELGKQTVSLHVFGSNHAARKLYMKNGFEETNVLMKKTLN